jgi:mevalonate pyrophosphate decarboxylase
MQTQKSTRQPKAKLEKRIFSICIAEPICQKVDKNAQKLGINKSFFYQKWIAEGANKEFGECIEEA